MATTPPPPSPSTLRVPAAPRHGPGYDQFSPYPTRYSARLANQRTSRPAEKTPPPEYPSSPSKGRSRGSPRKYRRVDEQVDGKTLSPPGSSSNLHTDTLLRERHPFNGSHSPPHDPSTLSGRSNLDSSTIHSQHHTTALPTPAKTPSKKKVSGDLSSTSRTLFPTHSNMRAKKPTPFSLESFDTAEPSNNIQIYTDSRDRVPKPSAFETPFNPVKKSGGSCDSSSAAHSSESIFTSSNEGTTGEPTTVIRNRRAAARTADNKVTMMFRGKKVYKYDEEEDDSGDELGLFASRPDLLEANRELLNSVKPLRRADIRPRQLFPQKSTDKPLTLEAYADDGDLFPAQPSAAAPSVTTPLDPEELQAPGAPTGPSRLTRSTARHGTQIEGTPAAAVASESQRRRNSPFDQWRRKKQNPEDASSSQTTPQKREARALSPTGPPIIKKTRQATRQGRSA